MCKTRSALTVLVGTIHDGETAKIAAGKDGLMFNGATAKKAA
jgi:hypothetical protein